MLPYHTTVLVDDGERGVVLIRVRRKLDGVSVEKDEITCGVICLIRIDDPDDIIFRKSDFTIYDIALQVIC